MTLFANLQLTLASLASVLTDGVSPSRSRRKSDFFSDFQFFGSSESSTIPQQFTILTCDVSKSKSRGFLGEIHRDSIRVEQQKTMMASKKDEADEAFLFYFFSRA
jgi:hypothetical protein